MESLKIPEMCQDCEQYKDNVGIWKRVLGITACEGVITVDFSSSVKYEGEYHQDFGITVDVCRKQPEDSKYGGRIIHDMDTQLHGEPGVIEV